jgi:uncharacterized protein with NAD-binding domain and iron-sulfur cluster
VPEAVRRVAIFGGGMAGLTAAWELSRPELRGQVEVTVHQRGWRLGGKGASSRGVHGRIEEHGLHVWLGYYDNAFRLIRDVYEELDRPTTDPGCPIRTWDEAFLPSELVGVVEKGPQGWTPWMARFGRNELVPGEAAHATQGIVRLAEQAVSLLTDAWASLQPEPKPDKPRGVFLTALPRPPGSGASGRSVLRQAEVAGLLAALRAGELTGPLPGPVLGPVTEGLSALAAELRGRLRHDDAGRRQWQLADLLTTCLRGMVADGLTGPERYPTIDHLDFRAWLARHGAAPETRRSPLVNALYDFTFAYEQGDRDRPAFAAGLGLFLATKMFFEYKGSIFWKMAAGMGDVVFAPLYQALRDRGVRFRFCSRLHALRLSAHASSVETVEIARQADLPADFDPLVTVKGLPCFPSGPPPGVPADAERHGAGRKACDDGDDESLQTLRAGEDFDVAVLAVSLGMVPHVAGDLVAELDPWRRLVDHVATVPTQAVQLWLDRSEAELGFDHPGATLSGWAKPLDTYASMTHLLPLEDWPADDRPRGLAYLCSALPESTTPTPTPTPTSEVEATTARMLDERMGDLWPAAVGPDGFDPDVLHGDLGEQHFVAATDPSDRYVQSLPGTGRHRLRPDQSGVDNLVLAGDWTSCGLDAGCIEAAVLSGLQAANAVQGRPLRQGVLGTWYPLDRPDSHEAPR